MASGSIKFIKTTLQMQSYKLPSNKYFSTFELKMNSVKIRSFLHFGGRNVV